MQAKPSRGIASCLVASSEFARNLRQLSLERIPGRIADRAAAIGIFGRHRASRSAKASSAQDDRGLVRTSRTDTSSTYRPTAPSTA